MTSLPQPSQRLSRERLRSLLRELPRRPACEPSPALPHEPRGSTPVERPLSLTLRCALALALAGAGAAAFAQTPPDAGALQQQIERDLQRPLPEVPKPVVPVAPAEKPAPSGVTVTVSAFVFQGNTKLSTEQLQAVTARFVGRPLSFAELQNVAAAVAEAYRAKGFVVRVFLPQQELNDGGVVTLQIVEARFGDVHIQPEKPGEKLRVKESRLRGTVLAAQPKGAPVSNTSIDRALLLADDLPGVQAGGALAAGQVEGETDLVLRVAAEPVVGGDVRVDNTGSRSTGSTRYSANLAWTSPTGNADLASANLLHTEGSNYGRLAYRLPLGYAGWSAGVNGSLMEYELVDSFAAFGSLGSATTFGLEAAYPILRTREAGLSLQLAVDLKEYDNEAAGIVTTRYGIDAVSAALTGQRSDAFFGGGSVSGNLMLAGGDVDLAGSPNEPADAITARTSGTFAKLVWGVSRQQQLGQRMSLRAALSGQFANKNLDSAEKFYIGGASAVRAYPSSDGSGSEGLLFKVEVLARLPWHFAPAAFYDWGRVRGNVDNDFPAAPSPNTYALQGAGLALAWSHPKGANARVTWAHRIGDNPNPDLKGNDQDGTLKRDRFWLEAGYAF
jgi:hemolysin activation/secretion protein